MSELQSLDRAMAYLAEAGACRSADGYWYHNGLRLAVGPIESCRLLKDRQIRGYSAGKRVVHTR